MASHRFVAHIWVCFLLVVACSRGEWRVSGSDIGAGDSFRWDTKVEPDASIATDLFDATIDGLSFDSTKETEDSKDFVEEEVTDNVPPELLSAFSTDGKSVTLRFSEVLDRTTAEDASSYDIKGSDNSTLRVISARQRQEFVKLELDPTAQINPSLTYTVWVSMDVKDLNNNPINPKSRSAKIKRSVYLALVWHQHQPFYVDIAKDGLTGPWVRKHATKDYYDMASMLRDYPQVHVTINLTAVLLTQLQKYYVERLAPFVDTKNNRVDEEAFLAQYRGKTDPWIDLLLDDTPDPEGKVAPKPTDQQLELFYNGAWSCLSTSDALMSFFPEYKALRDRAPVTYTHDDLLLLKVMFEIAWFDPDFLNGPVTLPDGSVVDLSDVVLKDEQGRFYLRGKPTEELANRLVAEEFKIMKNIVEIHRQLRFDPEECAKSAGCSGQIEISTTPFYHPILPLIYDSDIAKKVQPFDAMPPRFSFPEDAQAQVGRAVKFYVDLFGRPPIGMWPGEGSVAEEVVSSFVRYGIKWIATDQQVLVQTLQKMGLETSGCPHCKPYRLDSDVVSGDGGSQDDEMAIVFRDTGLSNKISWSYQPMWGQQAVLDLMKDIANMAPPFGGADRLIVIVMDGENAWEHFLKEHDAKGFLKALYRTLNDGAQMGEVVPVTVGEYLLGNDQRNVPAHPIHDLKELEPLWPGSWINGDFSVWIGEPEENAGWGYLLQARQALKASGLLPPDPMADPPQDKNSLQYQTYLAYDEMYAAEGSDWFWWYGDDMTSPSNDDTPFDSAFRGHLVGMFSAMNKALQLMGKPTVQVPDFPPLVQAKPKAPVGPFTTPPTIDGQILPSESWTSEAGVFQDADSGAVANPNDDIKTVYYGYTQDKFYLGLVFNLDLNQKINTPYSVSLYFSHKHITNADTGEFVQNPFNQTDRYGKELDFLMGGAAFDVRLDFSANPVRLKLFKADGNEGWIDGGSVQGAEIGGPVGAGTQVEIAIPFSALNLTFGDPLEFLVVTGDGGGERDRAPNLGGKVVFEDPTNMVYVTFEVDVSGTLLPLNTYGPINNPPPPDGKGIVYIAGNQDKLGNWIPNKIALRDDGQGGDSTPNDRKWSKTFGFMRGTLLRYKYTIGVPTDENKWAGTEEFPLTERGFTVTKNPQCKKMKVSDIFADRPQPSGTLGPHSVLQDCIQ